MPFNHRTLCAVLTLASIIAAQVVYIENDNPTTGTSNAFPWGQANGFSTLHVYYANQLAAGGVCPGAVLLDVAIAPSSGTSGTYSAPQARMVIGHLANSPPIAGSWESNIASPTVVHDLTSGPYTFPWTYNTWTPIPGFAAAGFVWDGATDIAIFYTTSPGVTGTFSGHRTATNLRHAVPIFGATTEAPTSNGNFAMKVRMTFSGGIGLYQTNGLGASLDVDMVQALPCLPAIINRGLNVTSLINVASANVGMVYDIAVTSPEDLVAVGGGGIQLAASGQIVNIDLSAPSLFFVNGPVLTPFPGNFSIPFASPVPIALAAQMVVLEPSNPDGVALSAGFKLNVQ